MFIVNLLGRCYGLTCNHVIGDEGIHQLVIMPRRDPVKGMLPVSAEGVSRINAHNETDLQDIAVIFFSDDVGPEFFGGTAYIINSDTVGSSETANRLRVHGFLTEKSRIDYEGQSVTLGQCNLGLTNVGATSSDPVLRQGLAAYAGLTFSDLDGISGSPVFDETADRLCGMVVRAGLNDSGEATFWYIDISHIVKFVEAVHEKQSRLNYSL